MTRRKPLGEKMMVTARVDAADVIALDALAERAGTVHYRRSRSELVQFAIREYVQRHGEQDAAKGKPK